MATMGAEVTPAGEHRQLAPTELQVAGVYLIACAEPDKC